MKKRGRKPPPKRFVVHSRTGPVSHDTPFWLTSRHAEIGVMEALGSQRHHRKSKRKLATVVLVRVVRSDHPDAVVALDEGCGALAPAHMCYMCCKTLREHGRYADAAKRVKWLTLGDTPDAPLQSAVTDEPVKTSAMRRYEFEHTCA